MRRFAAVIRRPLVWLPLLFSAWAWFFGAAIIPPARFTVRTGAADDLAMLSCVPSTWSSLQGVSDDGGQLILGIHHGRVCRDIDSRLEVWDTRTGTDRTPRLWHDAEWRRLLSAPACRDTGMMRLLSQRTGSEFLSDEAAWSALRRRLTAARAKALDDMGRTLRPVDNGEVRDLFPEGT